MGLIFSKLTKKSQVKPIVPALNHHVHHASTVSYDFNSAKGQIRALKALEAKEQKMESPRKKTKRIT